jgi:hypothetical protein
MKLGAGIVVAACALALAAAGCGGGGSSGASVSPAPAAEAEATPPATPAVAQDFHPVAGNFEPDETTLEECGDDGGNACYEQAFGNLTYNEGAQVALPLFDQKIAEPGPIEADCHRIAHTIGSASLARNKGNVAKAFSEGSSSCWSGYYHGILERSFAGVDVTSVTEMGRIASGLCEDPGVRAITWVLYQCVHGLGHGLMINSGYNLPFSLDVCEQLGSDWDRTSCKGGVFMENISSSYGFTSKWLKDDDPVYPCNWVAEDDKLYCYLMVTSRILREVDWDWRKAAEICAGVEPNWVATCFQSYGRDASGSTRQNPEGILELCKTAGEFGGETDCVNAAAKDMTANYTSGKQASVLCDEAPVALRGGCFYSIGAIMGSFTATTEERTADCREITKNEDYLQQCLRGADPFVTG